MPAIRSDQITVDIRARVVFQGRSSMTVTVEIAPDDPVAQESAPSITGRFLMVAVDGDRAPIPIPHSHCAEEVRS